MISPILETIKKQIVLLKQNGNIEEAKILQTQLDQMSEQDTSVFNNINITYNMFIDMFLQIKPFFDKMTLEDKNKFINLLLMNK